MKLHGWALPGLLALTIGCVPRGPVVDTGSKPVGVGGTIAGNVAAAAEDAPLSGRRVTAVNEATNARFETSTGTSGGYTLKVPSGTYRLEVELRAGETLETKPDATQVGVGDIDSARNFVVTRK
jgi:hypothetical protein